MMLAAFSGLCRAHVLLYAPLAKGPAALLANIFEQPGGNTQN